MKKERAKEIIGLALQYYLQEQVNSMKTIISDDYKVTHFNSIVETQTAIDKWYKELSSEIK